MGSRDLANTAHRGSRLSSTIGRFSVTLNGAAAHRHQRWCPLPPIVDTTGPPDVAQTDHNNRAVTTDDPGGLNVTLPPERDGTLVINFCTAPATGLPDPKPPMEFSRFGEGIMRGSPPLRGLLAMRPRLSKSPTHNGLTAGTRGNHSAQEIDLFKRSRHRRR
jgi:hypothetical protein